MKVVHPVDERTLRTLQWVEESSRAVGFEYLVVGATARDLVLHHLHGLRAMRATLDLDFGVKIGSWDSFEALKVDLCRRGFTLSNACHRFVSADGLSVDVVPFGDVAGDEFVIAWPPDQSVRMGVAGFREALEHADRLQVADEPLLEVPVASVEGFVVLKLIAWSERGTGASDKDAADIAYVLSVHERLPKVIDRLYEDDYTDVMERFDWDITFAATYSLGERVRAMVLPTTLKALLEIVAAERSGPREGRLAYGMGWAHAPRQIAQLDALFSGLEGRNNGSTQ